MKKLRLLFPLLSLVCLSACHIFDQSAISATQASGILSDCVTALSSKSFSFPNKLSYSYRYERESSSESESGSSKVTFTVEAQMEYDAESQCFSFVRLERNITQSPYYATAVFQCTYLWLKEETYHYAYGSRESENSLAGGTEKKGFSSDEISESLFHSRCDSEMNENVPLARQTSIISYFADVLASTNLFPAEESSSSSSSSSLPEGVRAGRKYQSTGPGNLSLAYAYEKSRTLSNSSGTNSSLEGNGYKLSIDSHLPVRIEETSYSQSAYESKATKSSNGTSSSQNSSSSIKASTVQEFSWGVCHFQEPDPSDFE